jgi:DNA (cytosine-5)-methyltransferase 1
MAAYYNEIDWYAAAWLRELIKAGLIAPGDVDERSISDVQASDLKGYSQCHFFAGIGGWSLALRLAGMPDDWECWTGSAPCQPYSQANLSEAKGQGDSRHLWPQLHRLIKVCLPSRIFGEQVAEAIEWGWLDDVFGDLESLSYACASVVFPAKAVGADHKRRRLYWLAYAGGEGREGHKPVHSVSCRPRPPHALIGNAFTGARRALDGDYSGLLPCNGLSVAMERRAIRGYGNAIVPQAAAHFIAACREAVEDQKG